MKLSTYHAHTTFCDGKSTAEEMILEAIARGCPEIGFSGHSHLPGESWTMTEDGVKKYYDTLVGLREKYRDKIAVYIGIEQDFCSKTPTLPFDYIIGSLHSVNPMGEELEVDNEKDKVREAVDKYYNGDAYAYCEDYYRRVVDIYDRTKCNIIGHFDLITKYIEKDNLFSEEHPRYIKARDEALDKLLETPALFEINTGAMARGHRTNPYPNISCIHRIARAGKPFVINSDSHSASTVDFGIDVVSEMLDSLGYKYIKSISEII